MKDIGKHRRGDPSILSQSLTWLSGRPLDSSSSSFVCFVLDMTPGSFPRSTVQPGPEVEKCSAFTTVVPLGLLSLPSPHAGSLILPLSGHIAAVLRKQMQAKPLTQMHHFPGGYHQCSKGLCHESCIKPQITKLNFSSQ